MSKLQALLEEFKEAVQRLEEVLRQEKNEFIRDSAIQRFEFSFDLSWKAIKAFLEEVHGIECRSPKSSLREAYRQGLIEYDPMWLEMVEDRNKTVHTYREEVAKEVYSKLPNYLSLFKKLLEGLTR